MKKLLVLAAMAAAGAAAAALSGKDVVRYFRMRSM
jgi:hypothetical protein